MSTTCNISLNGVPIATVKWTTNNLTESGVASVKFSDKGTCVGSGGIIKNALACGGKHFKTAAEKISAHDASLRIISSHFNFTRSFRCQAHLQSEHANVTSYWFGGQSPCRSDKSSVASFMVMCLVILLSNQEAGQSETLDPLFVFDLPDGTSLTLTRNGLVGNECHLPKKDVTHELIL